MQHGDVSGLVPLPVYISNRMPTITGMGLGNVSNGLTPSSGTYPAANQAIFTPFVLPAPYQVARLGWMNGSTVSASNHIDVGVFSDQGTKVVSTGSTAQGTASALQSAAPTTPIWLPAGRYYFGLACDSASATFQRVAVTAVSGRLLGFLQQLTAFPLPSIITPAQYAVSYMPLIWVSDHASF